MLKYTIAPVVGMHQRRDLKVSSSSPKQNGYETEKKKYHVTALPAKLMTCGMWSEGSTHGRAFFPLFLLTYSHDAPEQCVQQGWIKKKWEAFLQFSDKKDGGAVLFGANEANMDTPLTVKLTHPPPAACTLSVWEPSAQRHRWTLKAVRAWASRRFEYCLKQYQAWVHLTSISVNTGVNKCWPAYIEELHVDGCLCCRSWRAVCVELALMKGR